MIEPLYRADDNRYDNGMSYTAPDVAASFYPAYPFGMWHNFGEVDPLQRSKEIIHYAFDHG